MAWVCLTHLTFFKRLLELSSGSSIGGCNPTAWYRRTCRQHASHCLKRLPVETGNLHHTVAGANINNRVCTSTDSPYDVICLSSDIRPHLWCTINHAPNNHIGANHCVARLCSSGQQHSLACLWQHVRIVPQPLQGSNWQYQLQYQLQCWPVQLPPNGIMQVSSLMLPHERQEDCAAAMHNLLWSKYVPATNTQQGKGCLLAHTALSWLHLPA